MSSPTPRPEHRRADDSGTVAGELVVLCVVFFLLVAVNVLVGRLNVGSAHVEAAARIAARSVSLSRDPAAGFEDARAAASVVVDEGSPMCTTMDFPTPEVTATEVRVVVTCEVDLSAAALIAVPGSMTVTASATEPIDRYRENSGDPPR